MTILSDSFQELKRTARTSNDIATWLKSNLELFPDIPKDLNSKVHVEVSESSLGYYNSKPDKPVSMLAHLQIEVEVRGESSVSELFLETIGYQPSIDAPTVFYKKSIGLPIPAHEWPFLMVDALWDLHMSADAATTHNKKEIYRSVVEQHYPSFSFSTYESLASTELLPDEYSEFVDWAFAQLLSPNASSELPNQDFI